MKKFISILLIIMMIATLVSCGAKTEPEETTAANETTVADETTAAAESDSPAKMLLNEFKAKVSDDVVPADLAQELVTLEFIPFMGGSMEVEEGPLNGFTEEIKGFKSGAVFSPMIGSIPFVGYIFTLEDGADVNAFIDTLKASADLRWNICTQADEMLCEAVGNVVFFVMAPASFEDDGADAGADIELPPEMLG